MPSNNSKARKTWRRKRIQLFAEMGELDGTERLLMAIFGERPKFDIPKPGTETEND